MTPKQIVAELDRYIIGQSEAKRAVAIALRSRYRRLLAPQSMREEITPKNILMSGPTGCGKTEIARRLAKLTNSPFVRVEASSFTEVGYMGRDVESIIRDLLEASITMVTKEQHERNKESIERAAEEKLITLLLPGFAKYSGGPPSAKPHDSTREKLRKLLKEGKLDKATVEVEVESKPNIPVMMAGSNFEDFERSMADTLNTFFPKKSSKKKMTTDEALKFLASREAERVLDEGAILEEAKKRCEQQGIVFIDEIDKVISHRLPGGSRTDVSGEGVQRDLLPIVEGTVVPHRRSGGIKTDHILFICAGAFHGSTPSELMPEFQGRFPIRVELTPLSKADFQRVLTEPSNSLISQYQTMLATENVELCFTDEAIECMASIAHSVNETNENIGARRLYTIMECLLEDVSFEASDIGPTKVVITPKYVKERLDKVAKDEDLRKFIL
ncbi:MAG: ATP-dependent protease ATPase subunit HslU [Deltaproteobacteria bacterium]|jgi:ATP-dependent HslUV protease ATP-binding subunit HslU|nr:ATP-dependent protease ATPase subunit HslU [Deltaproteobacteria bacterium]